MHQSIHDLLKVQVPILACEHRLVQTCPHEQLEACENMSVQRLKYACCGSRQNTRPNVMMIRCCQSFQGEVRYVGVHQQNGLSLRGVCSQGLAYTAYHLRTFNIVDSRRLLPVHFSLEAR